MGGAAYPADSGHGVLRRKCEREKRGDYGTVTAGVSASARLMK